MDFLKRPDWCLDDSCTVLCHMETGGGGECIGALKEPVSHITENDNDMSTCSYDKIVKSAMRFYANKSDFVVAIYMIGESLKKRNLKIPKSIINNLPKEV